ncbi:MAG: aminotransferase class IV [Actinomycetota bacterium]
MIVWLDGNLVALDDARISPLDHGFTVGDGVFETLRVYGGVPFAWRRHIERLHASADALGLGPPSSDALLAAARDVLDRNDLREARLRITVTGGPAPPGSSRRDGTGPTAFVIAFPFEPSAATADVVVAPWTRNERGALAGLKTISYAANVRALAYAESRGVTEALFANTNGNLCEATGSNVFVVRDGTVCTPPAESGCLLGVTRALLLELCDALSLPVEERDVPIATLTGADEAFLSSTTREVQAIRRIDGTTLPAAPGPVAAMLAGAFRDLVARDLDP